MTPSSQVMSEAIMTEKKFTLEFIVEQDEILLREFLHEKGISKRTLTAVKYDGGLLLVNGSEQTVRHTLKQGDSVTVQFPQEEPSVGLVPETGNLAIVYEDEAILIIDKPAGQGTIPSRDQPNGTVANFVAGKFEAEHVPSTVHVLTRLDTDTSGLVCLAKNRHIHHLLSEQMQKIGFKRSYIAFVEGYVKKDAFTIEQPIGRKDGSIIERTVRQDGQYARTDVQVLGRFERDGVQLTSVSLKLHTGRTHQIRVHLQWLGHPLAGDDLYGGSRGLLGRQALHCACIGFRHPLTNELMTFMSELPADLKQLETGSDQSK
ncbi:RluA family pseudouridine synthase [Sporosarcina luteola]|uniref:RluA family pseudouridine synthase n=1 Tax=Sporosarcina luteola TaxID=582850 RepID=UPI00203F0957|nr:RluA family pseudouridine synthase [Sporosarcina luteola]MCM3636954.1 RluA family pseudouridine synthase [Sporosarcina luteola]